MKLKAQIIQKEIPTENIDALEQTLKEIGFEEQKIREIIDPLKKQVETTTTPEGPPEPGAPIEPETGVQPSKHVLQPGMTMKRLQSKDSVDEIFEEKVEEYLDSGEEFDVAVHKAHKHLERVLDYLELYGQRELKGPAKGKVFGDSLYDRLSSVVSMLDDIFPNVDKAESMDVQESIEDVQAHIEDIQAEVENILYELEPIVDEVKQVGIDAQGGISSPIDLGEWLY